MCIASFFYVFLRFLHLCPLIIGFRKAFFGLFPLCSEPCQEFIIAHVFRFAKIMLKFGNLILKFGNFRLQFLGKPCPAPFLSFALFLQPALLRGIACGFFLHFAEVFLCGYSGAVRDLFFRRLLGCHFLGSRRLDPLRCYAEARRKRRLVRYGDHGCR